jgi:hypothetical protein
MSGTFDIGLIAYAVTQVPISNLPDFLQFSVFTLPESDLWSYAKGGFFGAATAGLVGGVLHSTTETEQTILYEKIRKFAIAGGIGGISGLAISTVSMAPAAIASGAIAGYIAGEWAYENKTILAEKIRNFGKSIKSSLTESREYEVVPDFLCPQ